VLCLVRDDFWMAATRFSRDLEIDLVPDRNIAAVDLFEHKHARKVLAAFGRAYDAIPPGAGDLTKEQHAFLDQAIAALARDGQVVPVRLALFAEMVKGKPWTPATLRDVGGMAGVGVKFLEETFSSPRSSPRYRYHVNAVQSVLKSLLSETSADIKGRMRSIEELREVSGYAEKPGEFSDLVRILDNDLRLITPVDLESSLELVVPANLAAGGRYYQLTHDYLVRPLRDWIYRKQRETRRGRAELLLAERAALWNTKPERLHLPSAREWLWIRLLTRRADWTLAQQRMMARARRVHGVRFVGLVAAIALLAGLGAAYGVYVQTNQLLLSFSGVEVERIPQVINQLERYPRWVYKGRLRELANQPDADARLQLGYRLMLFHDDPGQVDDLFKRLLAGNLAEMAVIRDALVRFRAQISAAYRAELVDALLQSTEPPRFLILFSLFDEHNTALLADLKKGIDEPISAAANEKAKDEIAARRARAAVALLRLGEASAVWHMLDYSSDPRSRSAFISALNPLGADPRVLADELEKVVKSAAMAPVKNGEGGEKNAYLFDAELSRCRGLILAEATFPAAQLESPRREKLIALLKDLYRNDADAGIHSVAELVLTRFAQLEPPLPGVETPHRWYVSAVGHTMVRLDGPVEFGMGSPLTEPERQKHEVMHRRIIPRRFALASREVTVEQFQRYAEETQGSPHEFNEHYSPHSDGPMISLTWFDAVQYCNWLSDKEGLPRCYLPNDRGEYAEGMRIDHEAVAKGGYRLPTSAEWEYACRAGTVTCRYYGYAPDLLGQYEWYTVTSGFVSGSCGRLLPNELGLFDMLGNVSEWCHDRHLDQLPRLNDVVRDVIMSELVTDEKRNIRGETYAMIPAGLRSAAYTWNDPTDNRPDIGFRPARTIP
jgi:eukaryotic-like serine/threonine-protein kinase